MSEQKEQIVYSFTLRAEYVTDFFEFLNIYSSNGMKKMLFYFSEINIVSPVDNMGHGAVCSFKTTLSIGFVLDMLSEVYDGHRMIQTLNYSDKFTNECIHGRRTE